MKKEVDRLAAYRTLSDRDLIELLSCSDADTVSYLHRRAREVAFLHFGNKVYLRGLIEISNFCRNNCFYCGIRKDNSEITRYRLSHNEVLMCCREGYALGLRTFVLQGGEDPEQTASWVEAIVRDIHAEFPDCAITLSLGEKSYRSYLRLRNAGADRYLLRHETFDSGHYSYLHPPSMCIARRIECLRNLKKLGFQTGTGVMVGSPGQTLEHLVQDIRFIEELQPEMIGLGPFIPHHATPFAGETAGTIDRTLRLIAICRLMLPKALIPATTALASLPGKGRVGGILAGANVVMPNLSPPSLRKDYSLYDNKAAFGSESAQGIRDLAAELQDIGYEISMARGDHAGYEGWKPYFP
ncbi:[FeFe] hydrogenase H-cluster radical SAM maturase HydE [Porphyromonas macacae]|uniref:[FeFe] hydrogenase H-cluster radical SAM maturase HydE n=1 Tax=Porphyromonas macacae TaxID=28115 RepID=UPI0035A17438